MTDTVAQSDSTATAESILRDELASSDAMLETVGPILRHLLANEDASMFSDETLARVRGILTSLADELLGEVAKASGDDEFRAEGAGVADDLVAALVENRALLTHVHALALEWQLGERLQARLSLDPVLSPLLQALIAAQNDETAGNAMRFLAAQARHCQAMRRMSLPLCELPGDLLHGALIALRTLAGGNAGEDAHAAGAERAIRARYDEGASRLGLVSRLVTGMGGGATEALSVSHAGVAIFLSALALASGQDRDLVVFSTNEAQLARLAVALRASGLRTAAIEEQFMALHPDVTLPEGFDRLGPDRAAAMLDAAARLAGD